MKQQAELKVFGASFSFRDGPVDECTVSQLGQQRTATIATGKMHWLPVELEPDIVTAYLFNRCQIVAQLVIDPDSTVADLYTLRPGGKLSLSENNRKLPFEAAVQAAHESASRRR